MTSEDMTLMERVDAFRCLELPGQPRSWHMGTGYLVSDLVKEVERLEALLSQAPPAIKVNAAGTVAVSQSVFWLPIDHEAPLGVRLLLINKSAGRATDGQLGSNEKFFDHYQAFPKFKD